MQTRGVVGGVGRSAWAGTSRGVALVPTPECGASVTRHGAVEQLRDVLRRLWSRTKRPQRDEQVTSVAKGLLTSERFKGIDHIVAVQFDALEREAPVEYAEEFWRLGLAVMRAKHAAVAGVDAGRGVTLGEVLETERRAHAEREIRLAVWLEDKSSYQKAMGTLDADAAHQRANEQLSAFVYRRLAEASGPTITVMRTC